MKFTMKIMENKQQTAVEWLSEQFDSIVELYPSQFERVNMAIEQAKAMEKEQIVDAHIEGQRVFDNYQHTQWTTDQAEQYYKETYGE
jgi:3-dehydroquinate dehydratase